MIAARVLVVVLGALLPAQLSAQSAQPPVRVELGVEPREVTVGDPFRSVVRVILPEGFSLRYREFDSGDSIAATAPVSIARDREGRDVAVYNLVAWAVAPDLSAAATIEITGPDGTTRAESVRLQLPRVMSVLPADEDDITPRPPRGPIDPIDGRFPWWLLAALLAALLAYLIYRYLRRRPETAIETDPREWALEQLASDRIRQLIERGEAARIVEFVANTLRAYIARVDGGLGRDLTTSELQDRLRFSVGLPAGSTMAAKSESILSVDPVGGDQLISILRLADRVKFARHTPSMEGARDVLAGARGWVERYPPSGEPEEPRRAA